jgi:hypothetical protein
MQSFMDAVNDTLGMQGLNPTLSDPTMYLMWNLQPDITGGVFGKLLGMKALSTRLR